MITVKDRNFTLLGFVQPLNLLRLMKATPGQRFASIYEVHWAFVKVYILDKILLLSYFEIAFEYLLKVVLPEIVVRVVHVWV